MGAGVDNSRAGSFGLLKPRSKETEGIIAIAIDEMPHQLTGLIHQVER